MTKRVYPQIDAEDSGQIFKKEESTDYTDFTDFKRELIWIRMTSPILKPLSLYF